jgi:hypothetical protein
MIDGTSSDDFTLDRMALTPAEREDFSKYARNPETWVLAARRSAAVAKLLRQRADALIHATASDFVEFSGCHYASYFHTAMAVENALKAALISRDPSIVENGTLNTKKFGGKAGHALVNAAVAVFGTLTKTEQRVLTKLEEYVWAGRYTVPTKADVLYDAERMHNLRTSTPDDVMIVESLIERAVKAAGK